jgi:cobalt-zinc-cadmium efflux system protein
VTVAQSSPPASGPGVPTGEPTGSPFTAGEAKQARRLATVLFLITGFFVVELCGAIAARSVVLQADAIHLLMDVVALTMSVLAMRLAVRKPTVRFTFGMRRAEPVAALFNAGLVLTATTQIVREGIEQLNHGAAPRVDLVMIVASAALLVNGLSAWLLHDALQHGHGHHDDRHGHGHDHDHGAKKARPKHAGHALNLRGAWLHLAGDTLGSLAALVAAVAIRFGGPPTLDPLASFLVAAILVYGAMRLVRDATLVLLEASPRHVPVDTVRTVIGAFPGVVELHDLHVWTLGAGHDAITVHVRTRLTDPTFAARVSRKLREEFHVEYVTVQVEGETDACEASASKAEH